jgi:hypothetical protein
LKPRDTGTVINLMDALRNSLNTLGKSEPRPAEDRKSKKTHRASPKC